MAVSFYVTPTWSSEGDPANISQTSSVDDMVRITSNPGTTCNLTSCTSGNSITLQAGSGTVSTAHGAITSVRLRSRLYRSGNGGDNWCIVGKCGGDEFYDMRNYIAFFIDPDGDGVPGAATNYYLPNTQSWDAGYPRFSGVNFAGYYHNFATSPSSVNPATPFALDWDITSKVATWNDTVLTTCRWGWTQAGTDLGVNYRAGFKKSGGSTTTPRWNTSQLVLYVTAEDPPITYASGGNFMAV